MKKVVTKDDYKKCPYCGQLFTEDRLVNGKMPKHTVEYLVNCPYSRREPVEYSNKEPLLRRLTHLEFKEFEIANSRKAN